MAAPGSEELRKEVENDPVTQNRKRIEKLENWVGAQVPINEATWTSARQLTRLVERLDNLEADTAIPAVAVSIGREVESLGEDVHSLKQERGSHSRRITEAAARTTKLENLLDDLTGRLNNLEEMAGCATAKEPEPMPPSVYATLRRQNANLSQRVDAARKDAEAMRDDRNELRETLADVRGRMDKAKGELRDMTREVQTMADEHDKMRRSRDGHMADSNHRLGTLTLMTERVAEVRGRMLASCCTKWDESEHARGLVNGLKTAVAILDNVEPVLLDPPVIVQDALAVAELEAARTEAEVQTTGGAIDIHCPVAPASFPPLPTSARAVRLNQGFSS